MWTGQEKILGQKVNVKFFTVGPYVPLALVRQTILETRVLAKYIFLKSKHLKGRSGPRVGDVFY